MIVADKMDALMQDVMQCGLVKDAVVEWGGAMGYLGFSSLHLQPFCPLFEMNRLVQSRSIAGRLRYLHSQSHTAVNYAATPIHPDELTCQIFGSR